MFGNDGNIAEQSRSWIDEWMFDRLLTDVFRELDFDDKDIWEALSLIKIFTTHQYWLTEKEGFNAYKALEPFLGDSEVQQFLQINRYKNLLWFNKETFELLLAWMFFTGIIAITAKKENVEETITVNDLHKAIAKLREAAAQSQYQLGKFIDLIKENL